MIFALEDGTALGYAAPELRASRRMVVAAAKAHY